MERISIDFLSILSICITCDGGYKRLLFQPSSIATLPNIQVGKGGKFFIAYDNLLYVFNQDFVKQQRTKLSSRAIDMSISPEGKWLYICLEDFSCVVYTANDLSLLPIQTGLCLAGINNTFMIPFSNRLYVASVADENSSSVMQYLKIDIYFQESETNCSQNYYLATSSPKRVLYSGFGYGGFVYLVVLDEDSTQTIKIIRTFSPPSCQLSSLSLEICGLSNKLLDWTSEICGVYFFSQIFLGTFEASVVLSRCYDSLMFLCSYTLSHIDQKLDMLYKVCRDGIIKETPVVWSIDSVRCSANNVSS